ncbi:MAG: cyclic nucleotide-binding domain-containing protein [Pyrinomonadaceae bacterium]
MSETAKNSNRKIVLVLGLTLLMAGALAAVYSIEPRLQMLLPAATPTPVASPAPNASPAVTPTPDATVTADSMAATSFENTFKIARIVLWMGLAVILVRLLVAFIFGPVFRTSMGYEAPSLGRNIISILAYVTLFALIFKWQYPKVDLGAVLTTSAIFGVILGLALQDTLGNLFAGISLQADKPFVVGDVINVQGKGTGVVEGINWRGVKIRTFANHALLMSNSSLAKEAIEVAARDNLNARQVFFNTLYTDSPAKTVHIVREAVREVENVSPAIAPNVRVRSLADSGIDWEVKYFLIDYAKYNDTDALVRQRIWYAFHRAGISFAFPTRTLIVERKTKKEDDLGVMRDSVERLAAVDIFAPLTPDEIKQLALGAVRHMFAPDELVIRAGDPGSSMFVVNRGQVAVQVSENGKSRTVAELQEGSFFGEMALFTGEARSANVVATEETEVFEIGHEAMKHLFETNPDLVESLSHTIAERRVALNARPEGMDDQEDESAGIFSAIKRFFRLA